MEEGMVSVRYGGLETPYSLASKAGLTSNIVLEDSLKTG